MLQLPSKSIKMPSELIARVFQVEQYCGMVGLNKPTDMGKFVVSHMKGDTFTWWISWYTEVKITILACFGGHISKLSWLMRLFMLISNIKCTEIGIIEAINQHNKLYNTNFNTLYCIRANIPQMSQH